ncbi:hypothetical protein LCGC14_1247420 [marine sediment metagenome]|uniref:Uncharacterized protein n=1 Tax=marine sediment metagenome TaxID=412755 RepID=A0A0F9LQZ8_9ZZZZ
MKKLFKHTIGALLSFVLLLAILNPLVFGFGAMVGGSSDVVVEDETGYGDYRISLADGQSWFGGDNLTADLFDAGAGVFTSGTYAWTANGANTIANVANELQITYVDSSSGAYNNLRDSADLSSDLTIGQLYQYSFDAYINTGSADVVVDLTLGTDPTVTVTNTTKQSFVLYFIASHATNDQIRLGGGFGAGEIITLDNLVLKAVTSPAIYAGTGAFVRVCDSGGTDAANCATGYAGSAGTGETLGGELLSNPSFDANTTGWNPLASAVLASVAGGVSNNSLRITEGGENNPFTFSSGTSVAGKEYMTGVWVKQGTESTYRAYTDTSVYNDPGFLTDQEATATWVYINWYGVVFDTSESLVLMQIATLGAATTIFSDEASFKKVTEPNPNSVMILKTPGGTEGWLQIGATFDPNDISTFTISQ